MSQLEHFARAREYTQQPPVTSKPLTPAEYFKQHKLNLMAVGQSDTRTAEEKQSFSFEFTFFNIWRNHFVIRGRAGKERDFNFTGQTDFTRGSDRFSKGLGAVTAVTLDAVTNFHRWWNFHFILRWYFASCNYCRRNMANEDKTAQKVFAAFYIALMAMGALASALWAMPRYFSAWQNQREGRKVKNAATRFSNIRWRYLWMVPVVALIGAGLAASFGLPLVGAVFGAVCGLAFSWGYGIYASKYGVFGKADETIDFDGKHIPKKSWLKKLSKYPGFENQEVAMYAYAYLTNKMLQNTGYPTTSRQYKEAVQNRIEYKLRKQFKHGDLFDVMRYFQEEHARLQNALGQRHAPEDLRKMRTDFDMLTWLLNNTLNRQAAFQVNVPAYYQHEIRRVSHEAPPTQMQFTSPCDPKQAEVMRAQVQRGQAPDPYAGVQRELDQMQQSSAVPSAPPAELFADGYNPADLPPSYADVMAADQRAQVAADLNVSHRPPAFAHGFERDSRTYPLDRAQDASRTPNAPPPGYDQPSAPSKRANPFQ